MSNGIISSKEIGAAIRKRRKELGLTQEQLAEKAGVSYQQMQRYENGSSMLNVENVQRIAQSLQTPVSNLFADNRLLAIAEEPTPYQAEDEKILLRHFRKLYKITDRNLAITVVRRLTRQ